MANPIIRTGGFIALPAGGKEDAHQITTPARKSLGISPSVPRSLLKSPSTPDSGKFGVLAAFPGTPDGKSQPFMYLGPADASLDDWEGE